MKAMRVIFIMILILFSSFEYPQANPHEKKPSNQKHNDSENQESQTKLEIKTPIKARSLSGTVVDSAGFALPQVLVERCSKGWKDRLDATLTDPEGHFDFSGLPPGKYFLKASKSGFDTLLIRVITKKDSKNLLKIELHVSH